MTGPPSLMSGKTVKKVTKMPSTALMWIRSRLFLRWNNVWDNLSTSSMKRGPGLSPLDSILVHAAFAPCDGGLFQEQIRSIRGGSLLLLVLGHALPPPVACHVGGNAGDNGPLHIPTCSVTCMFVHYCALVTSFQKGGYAIIVKPIGFGYLRNISEIPHFTRMSIVSVHHLSFLMAHVSNQLSQCREAHCLTSRYH